MPCEALLKKWKNEYNKERVTVRERERERGRKKEQVFFLSTELTDNYMVYLCNGIRNSVQNIFFHL